MTNWKALAEALELGIPEADIGRIAPALEALEASFTSLAAKLPFDTEPAIVFRAAPEAEP